MLLRTLDYEEQFRCLAGRCPHSCCIGWEVVLDEDHARRYLAGDDPLSRRAAEAMVYDEEDDAPQGVGKGGVALPQALRQAPQGQLRLDTVILPVVPDPGKIDHGLPSPSVFSPS